MTNGYVDHRRAAAMETCDRNARTRGWDFRMEMIVDTAPWWIRGIEVLFRPSSILSLAFLSLAISLFWVA